MQGLLNNRDNEIMQRKTRIHKRLSKHVTRTCHTRRRLCKGESSVRQDTYATEEQAISAVSALSSDLRRSLDKVTALISRLTHPLALILP